MKNLIIIINAIAAIVYFIIIYCNLVSGGVHSMCFENETFCLFSFGSNVTVHDVTGAQQICDDAKNGSWPLEIHDDGVSKALDRFIVEFDIPIDTKFILNAKREGGTWRWIKSESDKIINTNGSMLTNDAELFYKHSKTWKSGNWIYNQSHTNKIVTICMIECQSFSEKYDNSRYIGATHHPNITKEKCQWKCETTFCVAWEWESKPNDQGCWIHSSLSDEKISRNIGGELHIIQKSTKSIDKCVGNVTEPIVFDPTSRDHGTPAINALYIYPLIAVIILIVLLHVVIFMICRNRKRKAVEKLNYQSNVNHYSSPIIKSTSPNQSNFKEQTESIEEESSRLVYADLLHPPKQGMTLKTTPPGDGMVGPMGDVYAVVRRE